MSLPAPATRRRVLVAEDDERLAAFVATALERSGYDVVVARDGLQALSLALEQRFDALLTDLRMPGLHGDAVAERARRVRPGLPVVLMTASPLSEVREEAWDAVVRKPFGLDALLGHVGRATEGWRPGFGYHAPAAGGVAERSNAAVSKTVIRR